MALTCSKCLSGQSWRCRDPQCANHKGANQPQEGGAIRTRPRKARAPKPYEPVVPRDNNDPVLSEQPLVKTPLTEAIRAALANGEKEHIITFRLGGRQNPLKKIGKNS